MDQFYTNEDVSIKCFETLKKEVNIESYDAQLEPSAGSGSFYKLMNFLSISFPFSVSIDSGWN